jgi:uncharacterized protein DUF6789
MVRADWLPRAIVSGFIAAVAMLFTFMVAYGLTYLAAGAPLAVGDWLYGLTHNALTDLAGSNLYAVAGLHVVVAVVWAVLYAYYAEPRVRGPGWLRGVSFSLLPWLISVFVLLPAAGGGILGAALGAGPLPVLGNLILHLAYGATLGAVYGPLGDIPADSFSALGPRDDDETHRRSEVRIAEGIVAGLVVGLLASLVVVLFQAVPGAPLQGMPQTAFVLSWTLIGGAFGAFVGSFLGLTAPR